MANLIYIEGKLLRNPNFRYTPRGTAVCTFTIVDIYRFRGRDGSEIEEYNFDIETWGDLAEKCNSMLQKGFGVEIKGRLKQDRWNDFQGKPHSRVFIVANSVEFGEDCLAVDGEGAKNENS
jgi:single-strand DNA-binding protein